MLTLAATVIRYERVADSSHGDSREKYNLTEPIPLQVEHVAFGFVVEPLCPCSCHADILSSDTVLTSYFTHNWDTRVGRECPILFCTGPRHLCVFQQLRSSSCLPATEYYHQYVIVLSKVTRLLALLDFFSLDKLEPGLDIVRALCIWCVCMCVCVCVCAFELVIADESQTPSTEATMNVLTRTRTTWTTTSAATGTTQRAGTGSIPTLTHKHTFHCCRTSRFCCFCVCLPSPCSCIGRHRL